MNQRWLLRMAKWAHNPPSAARVKLVLGVVAVALALGAVEYFVGWPEWLKVNAPVSRVPKL
ncbi:hypothetical protein BV394_01755 [Brevirhabdus pacifica]|uniref:Uncharacterized protein n=1 Tax=Brevirhabdus pacifica TaxID=1267768 RepID=A0A1U7DFF3_9RHOB|nr:hypothetical protein [Brevirhabdus pacifica]APX88608.1 hypothetical protein BV394_01755 [Brevirhabdus pacifica]OWU79890.1 hypothetical protein ATO5_02450 [Loktanella sp. 22II-4b]PJJ86898.1 hypothetical protein CLV77_1459 [Brevirhabdus pacifica]